MATPSTRSSSAPRDRRAPVDRRAPDRTAAPRPEPDDEPIPVLGGRFLIAALMIGLMIVLPQAGRVLEAKGPAPHDTSQWALGTVTDVQVTLITADYNKLTCAADKAVENAHCAYKSETEPWPRDPNAPLDDNKKDIIQPYRTWPDNKLILIAGLWNDPVVAMRLHAEPPHVVQEKKLARFVVDCRMRFMGRLESTKLRWAPGAQWQNEGPAFVTRPESCKLKEE